MKKRPHRLAQPLHPPRSHQRHVLRACVKSIYHFNIEVPGKILRVNFAVIPTYGKAVKYRHILRKLENLNEYLFTVEHVGSVFSSFLSTSSFYNFFCTPVCF